jgi:RNA polymerase sigma factor (TIGR02999 family)
MGGAWWRPDAGVDATLGASAVTPATDSPDPTEFLRLLRDAGRGDASALEALLPIVYEELKWVARRHRRASRSPTTLCTTELVHEAYLRLSRGSSLGWEGRAHFFGAASRAMRQVLVDFARRRRAAKRGGTWDRTTLGDAHGALEVELDRLLELDDALERLNAVDERLRRVVELRFFAGLSEEEIAEMLGLSVRTVERDWLKARLFLLRELDETEGATTS